MAGSFSLFEKHPPFLHTPSVRYGVDKLFSRQDLWLTDHDRFLSYKTEKHLIYGAFSCLAPPHRFPPPRIARINPPRNFGSLMV